MERLTCGRGWEYGGKGGEANSKKVCEKLHGSLICHREICSSNRIELIKNKRGKFWGKELSLDGYGGIRKKRG